MPLLLGSAEAADPQHIKDLKLLGKNLFFDTKLSIPANKQACASCHDPKKGWTLPDSKINSTTVVAPGAAPKARGNIKPPANAYASLIPHFQNAGGFAIGGTVVLPAWGGGNFWDGRAEGCGATANVPTAPCPAGTGAVSETIRWSDLPARYQNTSPDGYVQFLGPTADQAVNPFPNAVEQNIREKNVCQNAKTAKYKDLYKKAYGEEIDCSPNPKEAPKYRTSFKRLAVAIAAWQDSSEVNSFSSKRDKALAAKPGHKFPLKGFAGWTDQEDLGHDLFYGTNASGKNTGGPGGSPKNAQCAACHNGLPGKFAAAPPAPPLDPDGTHPEQLYADGRYHHVGLMFNPEIPGVANGVKVGLKAHAPKDPNGDTPEGFFKTPTLRNVAKGASASFTKAYFHNGYFKSLKQVVHFYNTRDTKDTCTGPLANATAAQAIANDCWPKPEFDNASVAGLGVGGPFDLIGNLGLSPGEEDAIVAYMETLNDTVTPTAP